MAKLLVITGPTASGKTWLAVELAKKLNGEIISADSMQIYKYLDIGTAKPTETERQGIKHHMIDIIEPEDSYSVARYAEDADKCVVDILARGRLPIVCGGTGLYIDGLLRGGGFMASGVPSGLRAQLEARWESEGADAMLSQLRAVDSETADKLHLNDKKRILRGLEVYHGTGETISAHNRRTQERAPRYEATIIGLGGDDREVLYNRINRRVDAMLKCGLEQEARGLYNAGRLVNTAAQAIGYKELIDYFEGRSTLGEAADMIKQKSRNYAKRQLTWFKKNPKIHWLEVDDSGENFQVLSKATKYLDGTV